MIPKGDPVTPIGSSTRQHIWTIATAVSNGIRLNPTMVGFASLSSFLISFSGYLVNSKNYI